MLLSEFSKVRKEWTARYVFNIADYRIEFRLKSFVAQRISVALQKQSFIIQAGRITHVLGRKAELIQRLFVEQRGF